MALALGRPGEFVESPAEGLGDGAQGDIERLGDVAVAESFGAEVEALPVKVRQGGDHRLDGALLLRTERLLFRVGGGVGEGMEIGFSAGGGGALQALQGEIAGYAEDPAVEVVARLTFEQMAVQREEGFLCDVLAFAERESQGAEIAKERGSEFREEADDFVVGGIGWILFPGRDDTSQLGPGEF